VLVEVRIESRRERQRCEPEAPPWVGGDQPDDTPAGEFHTLTQSGLGQRHVSVAKLDQPPPRLVGNGAREVDGYPAAVVAAPIDGGCPRARGVDDDKVTRLEQLG
jgi:hypothetical protein